MSLLTKNVMYFELAVALLSFRKIQQMAEVASPTDFS